MPLTLIRRRCTAAGLFAFVLVGCRLAVSEPTAGPAQAAAPSPAQAVVPRPTDPDSLKFAVLGDFGNGEPGQMLLAQQMLKTRAAFPYELVLLVGDNIYGSERPQDLQKKFEQPYKPLLDQKV